MKELKEVRFNESEIILQDNLVRGSILPEKISELTRNIIFKGDNVVDGPVFANRMEIQKGNHVVHGAAFVQQELYVNSDAEGSVEFKKCVASANSLVSRAAGCDLTFYSDVNAKTLTLYNAFVAGSIYADEVTLDNCIVIGGVFATQEISLKNTTVGTFNAPTVRVSGVVNLLLPSAFSIERLAAAAGTKMYNLSLADLGALYKGEEQSATSGRIEMTIDSDEVKSKLADEQVQKTLRSYTVVGKVLAADLLDTDKFQNHFLLTAASLGSQLLKTYDFGLGKDGQPIRLDIPTIRKFFFDVNSGKVEIKPMDATFCVSDIAGR